MPDMNSLAFTMLYPHARNWSASLEIFSPLLEKCVEHISKLLDIVWNSCPPLRKLFASLVSQAGYGPVYTIMSVERGWCRSGPCKNLTFCYEIFRKQVVLLVSSGKNKISSFLAPLRKILDNIFWPSCTQRLINYGQLVKHSALIRFD